MKSKLIKALIACLIVAAVGVGGYYGYKKFFAAKPAVTSSKYITASAKKMNMQVNVQGTGAAYAAVSKDISPNNNGTLKNLNLKVGDTVKSGATLFTSDSDDLRQNVTKAQNNLDKQNLSSSNVKNDNEKAVDSISLNDAQSQLDYAVQQVNKMTVTSPINGIITAENFSNGDSLQPAKPVLTVVDPSSMKIKVSVDELEIAKIKQGQKAEIKFGAIKDKTYEGSVETISQVGTSSNNVTTFDVVVAIKDPANVKIGMNANVNILVDSKENALTIPAEALIEKDGNKYVMVPSSDSSSTASNAGNSAQTDQKATAAAGQSAGSNAQAQGNSSQKRSTRNGGNSNMSAGFTGGGKLVQVKTGLENENYIEIVEGITEGQKVMISLPQTTSGTSNNKNMMGGFGGGFEGGMGGSRPQGGNGGNSNNGSSTKKN